MFASNTFMNVKPMRHLPFHAKLADEVVPLLSRQEGFKNAITFSDASGNGVTATTVWDTEAHANQFDNAGYSEMLEILDPYLDGAPKFMGNCTVY
jgi:heme-degrading monooxygenase HmoA